MTSQELTCDIACVFQLLGSLLRQARGVLPLVRQCWASIAPEPTKQPLHSGEGGGVVHSWPDLWMTQCEVGFPVLGSYCHPTHSMSHLLCPNANYRDLCQHAHCISPHIKCTARESNARTSCKYTTDYSLLLVIGMTASRVMKIFRFSNAIVYCWHVQKIVKSALIVGQQTVSTCSYSIEGVT